MTILIAWLTSGLLMAGYLRLIESITDNKVYTLLLNVDYLPVLKNATGIEWLELSLHMIVALAITWILSTFLLPRCSTEKQFLNYVIAFSILIGILLYPSTVLSNRTPALFDAEAWFWWLSSHLIYGISLGFLLANKKFKQLPSEG
jgi:hypothetical protein